MPLNFKPRAIFVYLRDKDDNRSCTPAGVKLTNEYTHRTNKNNPCTVSVIPSQLCTFFRKRTFLPWNRKSSTEEMKNSSEEKIDSSEVSFDSSEEFFLSSEEFALFLRTIWEIPPRKFGVVLMTCSPPLFRSSGGEEFKIIGADSSCEGTVWRPV